MSDYILKIEDALEEIRPFLKADGGDIALIEFTEDKILKLEFLGACKSCSMSESTFKIGVEEALKTAIPEIKDIEIVNMPTKEKLV